MVVVSPIGHRPFRDSRLSVNEVIFPANAANVEDRAEITKRDSLPYEFRKDRTETAVTVGCVTGSMTD